MTEPIISNEILSLLVPVLSTIFGFIVIKFRDSTNKIKTKVKLFESLLHEVNLALEDDAVTIDEAKRIMKLLRALSQ